MNLLKILSICVLIYLLKDLIGECFDAFIVIEKETKLFLVERFSVDPSVIKDREEVISALLKNFINSLIDNCHRLKQPEINRLKQQSNLLTRP